MTFDDHHFLCFAQRSGITLQKNVRKISPDNTARRLKSLENRSGFAEIQLRFYGLAFG